MKLKDFSLRITLGGLLLLAGAILPGRAVAGIFDFDEKPIMVQYSVSAVTTSTSIIIIDLSDRTNYSHSNTGGVNINGIEVEIAKVAASSGSIKLGVVTEVDASNGSVDYFWSMDFSKAAAGTEVSRKSDWSQNRIRTLIKSDATKYFATNDQDSGDSTYQTDVNLPTSVGGNGAPAAGDIIGKITNNGSNGMDIQIRVFYSTESP